ncbi:MAG: NAD(P) transhydrogenase subunit alpha [Verrucomicrobia bacterium]|nr:NAD(P) transhydrogenase subunit alpha [Verrucomicrobiota bacterium]
MRIFVPHPLGESAETRVPLVPSTASKLIKLGAHLEIESGLGDSVFFSDADYVSVGASVSSDRVRSFAAADMVLRLRKPPAGEVALLKQGAIHVSYLDPFIDLDLLQKVAAAGTSAICMEMIPRSTIAQKMDSLSSQANLGGYVAVLMAADRLNRILPMMSTPSGTIAPAKVFIIGVGVAGLQAIATAKRLGAVVEAFDTRPVVEEQVKSLGAKFVKVDLGDTGQTAQGYAKELTAEQLEKQRSVMAERCAQADIVITTAQVFGRKAPVIVTTQMVRGMKPGSVVVDMAVEGGGNVECSKLGEEVLVDGVLVLGHGNLPGRVPRVASEMYSNNLGNLIEHFWDRDTKTFKLDPANDILKHCLVTHAGSVCHESLRNLIAAKTASLS